VKNRLFVWSKRVWSPSHPSKPWPWTEAKKTGVKSIASHPIISLKTWRKSGRYWRGKQGEDSAEINERCCYERESTNLRERVSILEDFVPWFEDPFASLIYPLTGGVKTVKWKYEDSEEGRFVEELEYLKEVWKLKPLKRLKERRRERQWKLKRKDTATRVCY
jgi:hypothetical protein